MNEICVESCAVKRDCSGFEPKRGLKLEDMPRFPLKEMPEMSREEKLTSITIYLASVVDHLQGLEEYQQRLVPSPNLRATGLDMAKALAEATRAVENGVEQQPAQVDLDSDNVAAASEE